MPATPPDLIGRLAVRYQLIDTAQLARATLEHSRQPRRQLGDIMVELGLLSPGQLSQLLEAQRQYLATQEAKAQANVQAFVQAQVQAHPPPTAAHGTGQRPVVQPPAPRAPRHATLPAQRAPVAAPAAPAARAPTPSPQAYVQPAATQVPMGASAMATASTPQVEWLHRMLERAAKQGASDVHIHSASQVKGRVYGELRNLTKEVLSASDSESILMPSLLDWQREQLLATGEVDYAYSVANVGRYRVNVYRNHTGLCGVYHYIPATAPTLSALGLPEGAEKLVNHQNGIVLITGPSGAGKTSTMAALVNLINEDREDHVLSIEDPIEYVHTSKRCVVNQRQINRHTKSFANALKSALREDPDVICIGELRDLETISLALSAAETGHLVLGTLHTQGAVRTINRIIGVYPPRQQPQIRTMLSESLRAVISQKLLPRADGSGVVLAYELLFMNTATANLIRENRTFQLASVLQTGRNQGMRSMDDSLKELVTKQLITKRVAQLNSDNPKMFA